MNKIMVMAGGTGGHIFPAVAVAEQLKSEGFEVRWLGSQRGMESSIVPKLGFEFCALPVTAWHGGKLRKLLAPLNLLRALWASLVIFRMEKPNAVIGFGGYASAPGGFAAWILRTPIILHEQNGVPGLTNRKLENKAHTVLQAFPNTFKDSYDVVGNPIRASLCKIKRPSERLPGTHKVLRVLVLGGSQGAQSINELLPESVSLMKTKDLIEILHQSGTEKSEITREAYKEYGIDATVVEFIDDMAKAYEWCDLVVARSGASTVSELAAVGIPSILVPYPWHKDKQQYRNATWLADGNAAEWFEQKELTADKLAIRVDFWNNERAELLKRANMAWQLGIRDSAKRIVNVVKEVLKSKAA